MNANEIIDFLAATPTHTQRYEIQLPNCYYKYDSEADLLGIRKSNFCDEFEVKMTKSDFKADSRKSVSVLNENRRGRQVLKMEALESGLLSINYFWYAAPDGLITADEVPEFAGLVTLCQSPRGYTYANVVKNAKRLHSKKVSEAFKYKVAKKGMYRYWDMRRKK